MNRAYALAALAAKNLRRWRFAHMTIAVLTALSFVLYLLFSSQLASVEEQRLVNTQLLDLRYTDYIITRALKEPSYQGQMDAAFSDSWHTSQTVSQFQKSKIKNVDDAIELRVKSPVGELTLLGLKTERSSYNIPQEEILSGRTVADTEELMIPAGVAENYELQVGDSLNVISLAKGSPVERTLNIVGIYQDSFDFPPCFVDYAQAAQLAGTAEANRYLFTVADDALPQDTIAFLRLLYPEARILYNSLPLTMATDLTSLVWQSTFQLMLLMYLFSGVALFTIVLIIFLERRREWATLKTIGISNKQILYLTVREFGVAETIGLIVGLLSSLGFRFSLAAVQGLDFDLFMRFCFFAAMGSVAVFLVAQVFPTLTTLVASVTQLLFSRTIPLWVRRIDHTPDNAETAHRTAGGDRLLKLPMENGEPDCLLLRDRGSLVKQGEVVAVLESMGGIYVTQWVAPVNGLISDLESGGYMTIKPLE